MGGEACDEGLGAETVVWRPQSGPQKALLDCPLPEVFFGGARGGGKTDGVLGKWSFKEALYGPSFNAMMFRRTATSAQDAIERSKQIYAPLGGRFNEAKLTWRMPNGGRVGFGYLDSVDDAQEYQGRNVTDAWVEEAGQFATPAPIDRLFGVLRSADGVPVQLILTANPGGAGQHWLRERYQLYPFPRGPKALKRKLPNGAVHRYAVIPSRITDNRLLLAGDPEYVNRLHLVGSSQLVKAWLEGDWTAVEGAFFSEWSNELHVVAPFTIPTDWLRFRSGDWGSASPFSIGWWAVVGDDFAMRSLDGDVSPRHGLAGLSDSARPELSTSESEMGRSGSAHGARQRVRVIPRGALIRYREWYGAGPDGKGLKLTADQVADGIIDREKGDPKLSYGVLDPSAFAESGGPSIAERLNERLLKRKLISFHEADNKRVTRQTGDPAKAGPMGGWDQMRARLVGREGRPMIYCFSTCRDSIRTIPVLQHDQTRAEDLDTDAEDHAADDWRYACMSRPWQRSKPVPEEPRDAYHTADDELASSDSFMTM